MFRPRPVATAALMCLMLVGALFYHLRVDAIFACDGSKYGDDRFLAYCNSVSYADYDQGAFWYALEPGAVDHVRSADVLFVGNSKLQFALSTPETDAWFREHDISYYLFGFAHNETVEFFGPMLRKLQPKAKAFVIHVDRMFEDRKTPPMEMITADPGSERTFRTRRLWQPVHSSVCGALPALCGLNFGLHRSVSTGQWLFSGTQGIADEPIPVTLSADENPEGWADRVARASEFVSELPVSERCVFLTLIPSKDTRLQEATAIAGGLGLPLITPQVEGLTTFDRNHLDAASASRWSSALLAGIRDRVRDCVNSQPPIDH